MRLSLPNDLTLNIETSVVTLRGGGPVAKNGLKVSLHDLCSWSPILKMTLQTSVS
jgi:hypothetical protein